MKKRVVVKGKFMVLAAILLASAVLLSNIASCTHVNPYISEKFEDERNISQVEWYGFVRPCWFKGDGFPLGLLSTVVHTRCDDVEKSTEVLFGVFNEIDVDNDPGTGVNGRDISVQYLLFPWIEFEPHVALGLIFMINVRRIGEEIKDRDFSIYLEIGEGNRVGFRSPREAGNEIPDLTTVSLALLYYPYDMAVGLKFSLAPSYTNGYENRRIILFAEHQDAGVRRFFSFEFYPSIETHVTFKSTAKPGRWWYQFKRVSPWDSTITACFKTVRDADEKETILMIDRLPTELSFFLEVTPLAKEGGMLVYESNRMFDIELRVESEELGVCRYATLRNTPRKLVAKWTPTRQNGSFAVAVDSDGTEFVLQDLPVDPSVVFTVSNLEDIDIIMWWNLTNPGSFMVEKTTGVNLNLEFKLEEWRVYINSEFTAEYLWLDWNLNSSGYLGIDTDWQPINTINLTIISQLIGLRTIAEIFKAEDFRLSWTLLPPEEFDIIKTGELDFKSIAIDIFLAGSWYHLWPW
jgi:hypothetical protein